MAKQTKDRKDAFQLVYLLLIVALAMFVGFLMGMNEGFNEGLKQGNNICITSIETYYKAKYG